MFGYWVDEQFALVDEYHLNGFIVESEYHCMFWSEPSAHVYHFLFIDIAIFEGQFVFALGLEIAFEMIEQTDFFFKLVGVVFEVILLNYVLPLYSLNVVEEILAVCQHFCWVIEVDSNHIVTEGIADPVFWGIVNPLLNGDVDGLHLQN